jgi:hypothetical protein
MSIVPVICEVFLQATILMPALYDLLIDESCSGRRANVIDEINELHHLE